jgi:uncharacterized protein YbjT (DUF2867 family)
MKNNNNILVTGATGTVSSEVVKQLSVIGGANIKAAVHSTSSIDKIKSQGIDTIKIDYNNSETLHEGFKGVDKLFLLTPFQSNMVDLSSTLVKQAKRTGINHIVRLSAIGADAESRFTVGRLHGQVEKLIEESGIPYTFLRPNAYVQNFINFYGPTIENQNAFYLPAGEGKVSFVDVHDVAAVAVKSLMDSDRHTGKEYDITGSQALSYEEAAEILSYERGRRIRYVNISENDYRQGMKDVGMDELSINSTIELFAISRSGYLSKISPVVEDITGNKPVSFSQFAKDYAYSFK